MLTEVKLQTAPMVIKLGGAALDDAEACARTLASIGSLHRAAPGSVVLVHGGGSAVDRQLTRLGHSTVRHDGLRITPRDQIEDIASVLSGTVNASLCGRLSRLGVAAVGLRLTDGDSITIDRHAGTGVDLGCVGSVTGGDGALIRSLLHSGFLPIISSIGHDDTGELLNVNADDAAAGVARALGASSLVLLTDVDGVLDNDGVLVATLDATTAESLIERGVVHGGMVAKVRSAVRTAQLASTPVVITSWRDPAALRAIALGESKPGATPIRGTFVGPTIDSLRHHQATPTSQEDSAMASPTPSSTPRTDSAANQPSFVSSSCPKDLLTLAAWPRAVLHDVLSLSMLIKADPAAATSALQGRTIAMLFEKPSLRTRVSFESGIMKLGGSAIYLDHKDSRIGERESTEDYGRNLERWTDAIVARTYSHDTLTTLAESTTVPVINALSDLYHPCQALADTLTLAESFESLAGLPVAYIGDGNNVCHSLMYAAAHFGMHLTVITPSEFDPDDVVLAASHELASSNGSGGSITVTNTMDAASGCKAVYTDTWVSMGDTDHDGAKRSTLEPYRVTSAIMQQAASDAIFMHCLPAHRGDEVDASVIDGPQSVVFDQAENRMHAQNALLIHLLNADAAATIASGTHSE